MSHFRCPECGKIMVDTSRGYITSCAHYEGDIRVASREEAAKVARQICPGDEEGCEAVERILIDEMGETNESI